MEENLPKQQGVSPSPRENRLLDVAHVKQTPPSLRVLHGLVDQISQHAPLLRARILKLIQQPMIISGVEPPIDHQPRFLRLVIGVT